MTFKSGDYVAQHINDGELEDDQVQPNGVDLTIGKIFELKGSAIINRDSKELPYRSLIEPHTRHAFTSNTEIKDGVEYYNLKPGTSIVRYAEKIHIPDDCVGIVLPRSTIIRAGGMVNTALWDSGYEGIGEGRLVNANQLVLEYNARIAQIVFADAESFGQYDGQYQGENL